MTTSTLENRAQVRSTFVPWFGTHANLGEAKKLHKTYAPRLESAVNFLGSLETADAVALFLQHEGITGRIGISTECPVSVWLQREIGKLTRVAMTVSIPWDGATTVIDAPAAVVDFYHGFDEMKYPELQVPDGYGRVKVPA